MRLKVGDGQLFENKWGIHRFKSSMLGNKNKLHFHAFRSMKWEYVALPSLLKAHTRKRWQCLPYHLDEALENHKSLAKSKKITVELTWYMRKERSLSLEQVTYHFL